MLLKKSEFNSNGYIFDIDKNFKSGTTFDRILKHEKYETLSKFLKLYDDEMISMIHLSSLIDLFRFRRL